MRMKYTFVARLQPSKSSPGDADSARNVQDSDLLDDSLPSLDELFQASRNGDTPQVPHHYKPLHILKRQLIDEKCLLRDPTTPDSVYVPGNTQSRFLSLPLYASTPY